MCILFIGVDCHPKYDLIVCANRDEFHHRPTAPAMFWPPQNQILAGKDLQAGGTWLGLNKQGHIAGLTNIRSGTAQTENMRSRGDLVLKALSDEPLSLCWLKENSALYNPFNLIFSHQNQLVCYHSVSHKVTPLTSGFHAISNSALDDVWPKMAKGEQALEHLISAEPELEISQLATLMLDESQPRDHQLPQTGLSLEWERRLSSIYIRHPEYGTRSTSIILRDRQGHCQFAEYRYDGKGRQIGKQTFQFEQASPT